MVMQAQPGLQIIAETRDARDLGPIFSSLADLGGGAMLMIPTHGLSGHGTLASIR